MKIYREVEPFINQGFYDNATPIYKQIGMLGHGGYDYPCRTNSPVLYGCDCNGVVIGTYNYPNSGNTLLILTQEGKLYRHGYCHLNKFCVKVGDIVSMGDLIAFTGNTGAYTTGSHLHRELKEVVKTSKDTYEVVNGNNGYFGGLAYMGENEGDLNLYMNKNVILMVGIKKQINIILNIIIQKLWK